MNYKGINYDTGIKTLTGRITRPLFDVDAVTREIAIIKNELHCNAIRISGLYIERISVAAEIALRLGLSVWFSPVMAYDNRDNTLQYITDACKAAEKLRVVYPKLVFVLGCELSLFTAGFVKGDTGEARLASLFSPFSLIKNLLGINRAYNRRLNKFLHKAVKLIGQEFRGQLSYASGTWEKVDWAIFDLAGVDLYRSSHNAASFLNELRKYKKMEKPLFIMEFGCCSYKGAQDKGALGWTIADWKKDVPELKGDYTRDEQVQADYLTQLLEIFDREGLPGAFVFTFIMSNYMHDNNPRYDMDMASYGIVKVVPPGIKACHPALPWLPKQAFFELGRYYENH